jgi:hypothetical protein
MANQTDETTIINVRGVSASLWKQAGDCAKKQDESLGVWLTRAIRDRVNIEAGPRELPPLRAVNNAPEIANHDASTVVVLDAMSRLLTSVIAGGERIQKRNVRETNRLLYTTLRQVQGLPITPQRQPEQLADAAD